MPRRPTAFLALLLVHVGLAACHTPSPAAPPTATATAVAPAVPSSPEPTRDPVADRSRIVCNSSPLATVRFVAPYTQALVKHVDAVVDGDADALRRSERGLHEAAAPWAAVYREYAARDVDPALQRFLTRLADTVAKADPDAGLPDPAARLQAECTRLGYPPAP